jgi:hydroxymethylpyrimidine pyrophosphatase-like HAD family hydrolase
MNSHGNTTVIADHNVGVVIDYANDVLERSARAGNDAVVVFDIDSTLLFNQGNAPCGGVVNRYVKRLYDTAVALDMPIFIVTAREDSSDGRAFTLDQLACLGIKHFRRLYMRPTFAGSSVKNISIFKKECRKLIVHETNKRIALNVGDQWSDLFVCEQANADDLDRKYGRTQALFFEAPPHAFSDWCVKLPDA